MNAEFPRTEARIVAKIMDFGVELCLFSLPVMSPSINGNNNSNYIKVCLTIKKNKAV